MQFVVNFIKLCINADKNDWQLVRLLAVECVGHAKECLALRVHGATGSHWNPLVHLSPAQMRRPYAYYQVAEPTHGLLIIDYHRQQN